VYSHFFAIDAELSTIRRDGLASLFYVTNWVQIVSGQSYWAQTLAESPLKHLWSLAVEEQFYLLWPFVVIIAHRRLGQRGLLRLTVGLAAFGTCLTIGLSVFDLASPNSLYLGTFTRMAAPLAGAALGVWQFGQTPAQRARQAVVLELAVVPSTAVLALMWMLSSVEDQVLYRGGLAVSTIAGVVLVAGASTSRGRFGQVLSLAPLRYLGTISYGIYLWSWPVTQMVSIRHTELRGWSLVAVQCLLTLVLAYVSWHLVERPILAGAIGRRWSATALAAAGVATAIIIVVATLGSAVPEPSGAASEAYVRATGDPTRLMVVGDSVPDELARDGIIPLRNELGVSVLDRAIPACILIAGATEVHDPQGRNTGSAPCNDSWRELVQRFRPEVVMLMFGRYPNYLADVNGSFQLPCTPDFEAEQDRLLAQAATDLTSEGARLILVTAPGSTSDFILSGAPEGMNERVACLNDSYRRLAASRPDVDLVEFDQLVCPGIDECNEELNGVKLRDDGLHYTAESAPLLAQWLIPRVLTGKGPSIEDIEVSD
jgi:peptidoglycan/LPS O-acetylase OafA/YrhL